MRTNKVTNAVGKLVGVNIVNKTPSPGPFIMGNHPITSSPRWLQDCDSSLFFKGLKALKLPSRHHVEVKVKPACCSMLLSGPATSRDGLLKGKPRTCYTPAVNGAYRACIDVGRVRAVCIDSLKLEPPPTVVASRGRRSHLGLATSPAVNMSAHHPSVFSVEVCLRFRKARSWMVMSAADDEGDAVLDASVIKGRD